MSGCSYYKELPGLFWSSREKSGKIKFLRAYFSRHVGKNAVAHIINIWWAPYTPPTSTRARMHILHKCSIYSTLFDICVLLVFLYKRKLILVMRFIIFWILVTYKVLVHIVYFNSFVCSQKRLSHFNSKSVITLCFFFLLVFQR